MIRIVLAPANPCMLARTSAYIYLAPRPTEHPFRTYVQVTTTNNPRWSSVNAINHSQAARAARIPWSAPAITCAITGDQVNQAKRQTITTRAQHWCSRRYTVVARRLAITTIDSAVRLMQTLQQLEPCVGGSASVLHLMNLPDYRG